jgi:membrane protease YdiL (CAAX protease family)
VIFLPRPETFSSSTGELWRSFFWRIPALLLVLFLLGEGDFRLFRPRKGDLAVLGISFPGLCFTGFLTALAAALTGLVPGKDLSAPAGLHSWIRVIAGSLSAGYLEETYFRVYLLRRLPGLFQGKTAEHVFSRENLGRIPFPVLLFAFCHIYEGPWGFVNALLAGVFLSLVYIKTSSLHGIALAHGLYNITVYLRAALEL